MSAESDRHCINLELATGWAVHALEPDDEAAFARHLPGCAECEAEVQATGDVAVLLAADVEQLDPPAHLRAAVLNAARSPQVPRQSHPVGMTPRELAPVAQRRSPQRRSSRSAGRFSTSRRNLVAAASAVLLAFGAVAGWAGTTVFNQQGSTSGSALDEQNVMLALTDPSVRKVALTDKGSTTPMALLLAGPNGSTVLPVHMPAVASSSQYVLWGVPDGAGAKPVPLGGVSRDGDAHGARSVAAMSPSAPASFTRFAVSIEPAGSTPIAPTTTVATGDAQA